MAGKATVNLSLSARTSDGSSINHGANFSKVVGGNAIYKSVQTISSSSATTIELPASIASLGGCLLFIRNLSQNYDVHLSPDGTTFGMTLRPAEFCLFFSYSSSYYAKAVNGNADIEYIVVEV